ncbi:MAG TPA: bifunctional DNA-formamidopyrimidine glycosylase/DNA-(apurinic or apyrimidinic site) lyase [Gammaproteobacteria bacterium]|jgi:formamidopyrimidine-DNA glycosylase|nr:bifunctional DNA-formamidopyrimidine glycosylase/DNA-(apurinic or apyrimidinic site) lyase [Gammaproteobacteria bacterium]
MPELPEVETARRGIAPHLVSHRVTAVVVRDRRLRWPVPAALLKELPGQRIEDVARRGKYLLLKTRAGTALLHLGMSGSLRITPRDTPPLKHDHVDLVMDTGKALRLRDPRRFGALLWTRDDPGKHKLLKGLGPEPLGDELDGEYLFEASRGRKVAVKQFIMDSHVVVGVGNIYASESLFLAAIKPQRAAGRVSRKEYDALARGIKKVLTASIKAGGTTLRDFAREDGEPGYFSQRLRVYDRAGERCYRCGGTIVAKVMGQRSTYYCPDCQK